MLDSIIAGRELAYRRIVTGSLLLLYLGSSCFVFSLWLIRGRAFNTFEPARADLVTYGGAKRPYNSRVLIPWMARASSGLIPEQIERELVERTLTRYPGLGNVLGYFNAPPDFALELICIIGWDFLSLFAFMFVLRKLFAALFTASNWVRGLAPVFTVLTLPILFASGTHFFYDLPALFLFAAALLFMKRRDWRFMYPCLAAGILNKETMVLISLVFVVYFWDRMPRKLLVRHTLAQLSLALLLKVLAVQVSQPAGAIDDRNNYLRDYFETNLMAFWNSPLLYDMQLLAACLFLIVMVTWKLPDKPMFLRRSCVVLIPLFAGFMRGGLWGEIRIFYEAFPILSLMAYHSLVSWIGLSIESKRDPATAAVASGGQMFRVAAVTSVAVLLLWIVQTVLVAFIMKLG